MADKFGRKKFAMLYCALYIGSCCTKHFNNYWILMVGRVLGGVATSLLFSVFESWMVAEHNHRGFSPEQLSDTFSKSMFCNSLVAIASGFMANFAADQKGLTESMAWPGFYTGGNSSPFDLAMLFLGACWLCISLKWSENYGDQGAPDTEASALSLSAIMDGVEIIRNDSKIFIIGVLAACFEGSMYTFVFLWTPILTKADSSSLPFGNIFAVSGSSTLHAV
jgi:MFS family permease